MGERGWAPVGGRGGSGFAPVGERRLVVVGSLPILVLGLYWLLERLAG